MKHVLYSLSLLLIASPAFAHGGGLNAAGCHNNRKTGGYHCHRSSYTPRAPARPSGSTSFAAPSSQSTLIADDNVFAAQVVLKKNGCYTGALDGKLGPGTVYAIKLFEANEGLDVTGKLTAETKKAIKAKHADSTVCR